MPLLRSASAERARGGGTRERCANGHDGVVFGTRTLMRRLGPIGVALTVYDVWRRLPAKQREQLLDQGIRHGSRAARFVIDQGNAQLKKHRD